MANSAGFSHSRKSHYIKYLWCTYVVRIKCAYIDKMTIGTQKYAHTQTEIYRKCIRATGFSLHLKSSQKLDAFLANKISPGFWPIWWTKISLSVSEIFTKQAWNSLCSWAHPRIQVWGYVDCLVRNDWWPFLSLACLVRHFIKTALKFWSHPRADGWCKHSK